MSTFSSLYIHIPFCNKICPFCDFTKLKINEPLFIPYYNCLIKELTEYSKHPITLTSIYFGGGTPSTLPYQLIQQLLKEIRNKFNLIEAIEISFEMNPEDVTQDYLNGLIKAGVNRISLGIQTFNDDECKQLGRNHNSQEAEKALTLIKGNINNVNIDLMFALPNSTNKSIEYSLHKALSYSPQHISCYSLTIEPKTPFFKDKVKKAPEHIDTEQFKYIIKTLKNKNYNQYEISSFAMPGFECNHNKSYWAFKNYIGIGIGAHSLFNKKKFKKTSKIQHYLKNPLDYEITCCNQEELIIEHIIANLRRSEGLIYEDFFKNYNVDFVKKFSSSIKDLKNNKLIKVNTSGFTLTKKGLYLLDDVCLSFL